MPSEMLNGISGSQVAVHVANVNNHTSQGTRATTDAVKRDQVDVENNTVKVKSPETLKEEDGAGQGDVEPDFPAESTDTPSHGVIIGVKIEDNRKKNCVTLPKQKESPISAVVTHTHETNLKQPIIQSKKRIRKGIFISYSPEAGYEERRFISDLVCQLKENNLAEDIWFDKDEACIDSPTWYSQRMEAVEKCQAAIVILTDHYFTCSISLHEMHALLERNKDNSQTVKIFPVLYSDLQEIELPRQYNLLLKDMVNLTGGLQEKLSIAEKSSVVIGNLMEELEQYAVMHMAPTSVSDADAVFTGEYKSKKVCQWNVADLQEWLYGLGIKEFYRQNLAENMVDGFLLLSMTDANMTSLGIESRVVRKKVMQQILTALDKEHKMPDNWHLRARSQRSRANTVYLVYDPADVRLAQTFKQDLLKKGLQVINHQKLGQSKDEFLKLNGPQMSSATFVLLVLTESAISSPFVFHETMFADWLGKKTLVAMYKNVWPNMRPALRAVLGECLAVDFERNLYSESMDVLEHHIKPMRTIPGLVLEQSYLTKMAEGLKPLEKLAAARNEYPPANTSEPSHLIFISFQWDMQSKIEDIRKLLEQGGYTCWCDVGTNMRGHSSLSSRSGLGTSMSSVSESTSESLQSHIQRSMRNAAAVLCLITPKYIQSDNCFKDLTLAESLKKPIIPLLMRFCSWPPEGAPPQVKKALAKCTDMVELYNDKLYKQNLPLILDRLRKSVGRYK